jgi:hypothetical protein
MEILALMNDGFANTEVADCLLSRPRQSIITFPPYSAKLDAHTRAEAVSIALQSGLINQNRERPAPK